MSHPFTSLLRTLMVLSNIFYAAGAYYFDWNETHVKNPNWPPHARFHNGQTMSLGVLLCSMSIYLLSQSSSSSINKSSAAAASRAKESLLLAALIGSFYCTAGFTAILYPGTDWKDPESTVPHAVQKWIFGGQLAGNWTGYLLELRNLRLEEARLKKVKAAR